MDGRHNRRNKSAFSNSYGIVWTALYILSLRGVVFLTALFVFCFYFLFISFFYLTFGLLKIKMDVSIRRRFLK